MGVCKWEAGIRWGDEGERGTLGARTRGAMRRLRMRGRMRMRMMTRGTLC